MQAVLACEQCTRRKRRCDKTLPCSSCRQAGILCTPVKRFRLPRGNTASAIEKKTPATRDSAATRISRLEKLVSELQHTVNGSHDAKAIARASSPSSSKARAGSMPSDFLAQDFWAMLSDEMTGLREALCGSDQANSNSTPGGSAATDSSYGYYQVEVPKERGNKLFLAQQSRSPKLNAPLPPRDKIFKIYEYRVDTIIKVFHLPTMIGRLSNEHVMSPGLQAIESAMTLLAVCSLNENDCRDQLGNEKETSVRRCKVDVEAKLSLVMWLSSNELEVLQALVVYTLALRSISADSSAWTLVAILARKADAIGLGGEKEMQHSALELQDRAWLLCCISLLDAQSALDRGSWPLFPGDTPRGRAAYVNARISSAVSGFGNTPCWPLQCEATICLKKLYTQLDVGGASYVSLQQVVNDFEGLVKERYTPFLDMQRPEHILASLVAHESVVTMRLLVVRPLQKVKSPATPPNGSFDILGLAVDVLKSSIKKATTTEIHRWAWYAWTKWYALAVALAELCVTQDAAKLAEAWEVVTPCFERYAAFVADGRHGLLWAPIERLMVRAQKRREALAKAALIGEPLDQTSSSLVPLLRPTETFAAVHGVSMKSPQLNLDAETQALPDGSFDLSVNAMDLDLDDQAWLNWEMFINDMGDPSLVF